VLGYEADGASSGAPFFVMEKIDGVIPRRPAVVGHRRLIVDAAPAQRRALWERAVRMMSELHRSPRRFLFLRTGGRRRAGSAIASTTGMRSLRWASPANRCAAHQCEDWLLANSRRSPALSWVTADCRT